MSLLINAVVDIDTSRKTQYKWWCGSKCGSAVAEFESQPSHCVSVLMIFNVYLFLNTMSEMIYVDTFDRCFLSSEFGIRKSGGIIHDKNEISLFSIITLDVQLQYRRMSNLSSGGSS